MQVITNYNQHITVLFAIKLIFKTVIKILTFILDKNIGNKCKDIKTRYIVFFFCLIPYYYAIQNIAVSLTTGYRTKATQLLYNNKANFKIAS